ncbi:MAG: hypothetical protein WB995_09650, partial [Candidatus Acidiferrales bacterium]
MLAGGVLSLAFAARGRERALFSSPPQEPIQTVSALVIVEASVADGRGNFLGNIERSQFHVFDDGVEQPLSIFQTIQ